MHLNGLIVINISGLFKNKAVYRYYFFLSNNIYDYYFLGTVVQKHFDQTGLIIFCINFNQFSSNFHNFNGTNLASYEINKIYQCYITNINYEENYKNNIIT